MNLVYGSFCPLHEGNARCPCRTLTTNASIWTAAELGDVDRVKTVVTVKGRRPDSLDPHGYTPLHFAAQNGRLAVVQYLLQAGAGPDGVPVEAGGCGATPLHRAAFAGQLPCVRALLSAGARPSAADASFLDMRTPLHKAAGQGHRDVCVALLEAGADPNSRDAAGKSALDVLDDATPASSALENDMGGGGAEACSIVVMSGGEERDWKGAREALERFGGLRKGKEAADGREDADGDPAGCCEDAVGRVGGIEPGGARLVQEAAPVPSPAVPSASNHVVRIDAGSEGREEALGGVGPISSTSAGGKSSAVAAVAPPAPGAPKGQPKAGTSAAGIPCGECNLPKVVMVRASCCGGLLCKSCLWEICARRHDCRRCRDSSGS